MILAFSTQIRDDFNIEIDKINFHTWCVLVFRMRFSLQLICTFTISSFLSFSFSLCLSTLYSIFISILWDFYSILFDTSIFLHFCCCCCRCCSQSNIEMVFIFIFVPYPLWINTMHKHMHVNSKYISISYSRSYRNEYDIVIFFGKYREKAFVYQNNVQNKWNEKLTETYEIEIWIMSLVLRFFFSYFNIWITFDVWIVFDIDD